MIAPTTAGVRTFPRRFIARAHSNPRVGSFSQK
jgi:hypothetical protein